jgi:tetratricopeptide (TPR) repeat protein
MINIHLERGKLLLAQKRLADAEKEFKQALSHAPNDAYAMAWLAECYLSGKRYAEALELGERAMGHAPNDPFLLYTMARAYFYNQNTKKAREMIRQGLQLNPADADFFLLLAHVAFYEEKWQEALDAAEQGLEQDAENVNLVNIRAQALVKLNRKAEAAQTIDYALHKAPEDSYSHANRGWVAIEQSRFKEAQQNFREALRLNPNNEYARSGLKEAIKGENIFYRGLLKYFLWMAKMNEQNRWAVVIGAYIIYRVVLGVARSNPALAPLLYPIIALYVLFALSSWIAIPIANLFLRLHPIGKHALTEDEKMRSNIAGGLVGLSLLALAGYFISDAGQLLFLGLVFGLLLVPAGGTFSVSEGTKARRSLTIYSLALAAVGIIGALVPSLGSWLIIVFALGIFAYGWVANYLIGQDAKAF